MIPTIELASLTMKMPAWKRVGMAIEKVLDKDLSQKLGGKYLRYGDYHWRAYKCKKRKNLYREHVNFITNWFKDKEGELLDVGCGDGLILALLNKNKKLSCEGIDISPLAIELAKSHGITNCEESDFEDYVSFQSFNYILLSEILEHAKNPELILQNVYRLLDDNGILFISIPFQKKLELGDLHLFSKGDMVNLLTESGFRIVKYIRQKGFFKMYFICRKGESDV